MVTIEKKLFRTLCSLSGKWKASGETPVLRYYVINGYESFFFKGMSCWVDKYMRLE